MLTDRIAEVLRPCAMYGIDVGLLAQRIAAELHLTEVLVKEGEVPPLYAIQGWRRGA